MSHWTLTGGQVGDYSLRVWDVDTGREVSRLTGHKDVVRGVALSPDGLQAISASLDGTVRLWDVQNGRETRSFKTLAFSIALSPDGKRIAEGGVKTLLLRDLETGQAVHVFEGHAHPILSIAFSTDGGLVLTGSNDRTVRLWSVPQ